MDVRDWRITKFVKLQRQRDKRDTAIFTFNNVYMGEGERPFKKLFASTEKSGVLFSNKNAIHAMAILKITQYSRISGYRCYGSTANATIMIASVTAAVTEE